MLLKCADNFFFPHSTEIEKTRCGPNATFDVTPSQFTVPSDGNLSFKKRSVKPHPVLDKRFVTVAADKKRIAFCV